MKSNQPFVRLNSLRGVITFGLLLALLGTAGFRPVSAQGFRVESKAERSVVGGGTFVSLEGRFSISLPQNHNGFKPLSVDTVVGRATGDAYNWNMKEGSFTAGYVNLLQPMDDPGTSIKFFATIRDGLVAWAGAKNGKLVAERQFDFKKHPAYELKLEFPEVLLFQRFYLVSSRLYQVLLVLRAEQRTFEAVAVKVLESFDVLSDADVTALLKTKAAEAEPNPLPQQPMVARVRSDAEDKGLRSAVKTVFQEVEDLSGTWSVQGRKPSSMEYYNERGNLMKGERYDYKGNLSEITVYGYLDGARVSSRKSIEHAYNPPPMIVASPAGEARPKSDQRYSNKYTFQYDAQKRLIEKTWFMNNGQLSIRYVFKYSGNQREEFVYTADGSLNQHYVYILDATGNEVEQTIFEPKDGSIRHKHSYAYEFDPNGNWIKRTISRLVTENGKPHYAPVSVDYRTITYY